MAASVKKGQRPHMVLEANKQDQKMSVADAVQAAMAKAQEASHKPAEPDSPPRQAVLNKIAEDLSPSKEAAHLLRRVLRVTSAPLHKRTSPQLTLPQLLDGYQVRFWEFIKTNSSNPAIQAGNVRIEVLIALKDVFSSVRNRDFLDRYVQSLASGELAEEFQAFDHKLNVLKSELEKVGIQGFQEGELPVFWSGPEAAEKAKAEKLINTAIKTDSDIPLFKTLFDCWGYIKEQKHELSEELVNMLPILFSVMFAKYAVGEVHLYVSSKNDEISSVFNVDSAAWTELYMLTQNSAVSKVYLHQHLKADLWADPIDLKSQDPHQRTLLDKTVHLSKRGDAELQVSIATIKRRANMWKKIALRRLDGSSDC